MAERLVCPVGHEWDASECSGKLPSLSCPICGSDSLTPDSLDDSLPNNPDELPPPPYQRVGEITPSRPPTRSASGKEPTTFVGDYQVLAELGRGGMGVVYRARQTSLNRIVALKMILAGEYASPELLVRFRNEAETVARLQHPHIVQIHEVGEESGRPFFSLEFVDGKSLAQQLAGAPLEPLKAADLMRTLARAMQYAHERSVIHRDLKPANVLIAADGTPKIADFGLARLLDKDGGDTRTGSVLGTPSYMAPEQTRGETRVIGPATDIYALGAVLYESVTGRPPFRAATPLETARQVVTEEPVPPSRLQPKLPKDLETICLKCLQKDPTRRYPSAKDLADDLGRFLSGEPITARPVGIRERSWKWMKRRPTAAALVAVAVVATIALVGGGVLYNARMQRERDNAQRNFQMALDAVNRSYTQISEDLLLNAPHMEPMRRRLLQSAREFYEQFVRERSNDPTLQAELARAYWRMGNITRQTGSKDESRALFEKAIEIQQRLVDEQPGALDFQVDLALSRVNLAGVCAEQGQLKQAEEMYDAALPTLRRQVRDEPNHGENRARLAHAINALGSTRRALSRNEEAKAAHEEALAILKDLVGDNSGPVECRHRVAEAHTGLGDLCSVAGDFGGAKNHYSAASEFLGQLVREHPEHPVFLNERAHAYRNLSRVENQAGNHADAVAHIEKSLADFQQLAREHPTVVGYQTDLAMAYYQFGEACLSKGDLPKAEAAYHQALPIREHLVRLEPNVPDHRDRLASVHNSLAQVYNAQGNTSAYQAEMLQALRITEELAKEYPKRLDYQIWLGMMYFNGAATAEGNDLERLVWFDKAIGVLEPIRKSIPKHDRTRLMLCVAYGDRGYTRGRLGRAEALSDWDRALELDDGKLRGSLRARRAITLAHLGDCKQALAEVEELSTPGVLDGGGLYDLARACSVAASTTNGDSKLALIERNALVERYVARALEFLASAASAGYFTGALQVELMKKDADFGALRQRDDFKKLLTELENRPEQGSPP